MRTLRKYSTREEAKKAASEQTKEWMRTHKWFCECCDRSYHVTTKHRHVKTKKHLRNVALNPSKEPPKVVTKVVTSAEEKRRLREETRKAWTEAHKWFCDVCERSYDAVTKRTHFTCAKHLLTLKVKSLEEALRERTIEEATQAPHKISRRLSI